MLPLQQFLERFKNLTNTEKVKKQLVAEIFSKNNIPITVQQISFSKNVIFVKVSPIVRTELLLKKETIIKEVKNIPGLSMMTNIQ